MSLSPSELTRYSRHIFLPELRKAGQERLKSSHVFVLGAGGLGSPVLMYLAAAGVGKITFIDKDHLDLTNLQRQTLYKTSQVDRAKAESAEVFLRELNPEINIRALTGELTPDNALDLMKGSDLIIETSDNFGSKFLVNDAAVILRIPLIIGGILRFEGQVMAVKPGDSPCYRCIFTAPPPQDATANCSEAGVLGSVAGVVGSMMASEALKILTDSGTALYNSMLRINILESEFRKIKLPQNPDCPVCGNAPTINKLEKNNYHPALEACDINKDDVPDFLKRR